MQVADLFAKLSLKPDKSSFSAGDRLIRGIKGALVGLGVFQGARFLKGLVEDSVALGDNLAKVSSQLNISTTALQELEFAAKQSDLEFAGLTQGLKFLTRNAFQAANGSKEMRKNFKQLGISAAELKSLKPDELLLEVAEAFETLPEGQKIPRAMEIFGRQGAELVPFLSKGKKGIAELRREAERLGLIIPPEQVEAFAKADDKFNKFSFTIRKVKAAIASALLPIIEKYLDKLQTWLSDGDNMERLMERTEKAIRIFAQALDKVAAAFGWMIDNWDTLQPILITIAGIWAAGKVAGFASALWGVASAFGGLGLAGSAAAAGILVAWHDIAAAAKGEWDKAFFAPVHEAASNLLMDLEEFVDPIEDREEKRRAMLRILNPEEAARRDERDAQRKAASQAMRRGQFNPANFPALYPQAAADAKSQASITNSTVSNTINVTSPNADPAMVAKEVVASFERIMRSGSAALQ